MSTHNIGFYEDLTNIIFELSSNIIKYAPYFFCCILKIWCNHSKIRTKRFHHRNATKICRWKYSLDTDQIDAPLGACEILYGKRCF